MKRMTESVYFLKAKKIMTKVRLLAHEDEETPEIVPAFPSVISKS
jgi:hypothetical protein